MEISSEEAKALCEKDGWQVAKMEHILSFGEKFPEKQKEFPIIGLGTICEINNDYRVLRLWYEKKIRKLSLDYYGVCNWGSRCRFLRVRKIS